MARTPAKPKKKRAAATLGPDKTARLYAALAEDLPAPKTELDYHNPYTLVVAVALSAQATDVGVNKATKKLFEIADTPKDDVSLTVAQYYRLKGPVRL